MWFAKWFGGREREDDSEPSEHPPHPLASAPPAAPTTVRPSSSRDTRQKTAAKGKGFDPYNSGSFDKNKAWEKVKR